MAGTVLARPVSHLARLSWLLRQPGQHEMLKQLLDYLKAPFRLVGVTSIT
jgi:hypothetical protein